MTERLRELGSDESVSAVVEDTVAMCLEKEPAKRPPTVGAVLKLLERSDVPVTVTEVAEEKEVAKERTERKVEGEDEEEHEDEELTGEKSPKGFAPGPPEPEIRVQTAGDTPSPNGQSGSDGEGRGVGELQSQDAQTHGEGDQRVEA